MDGPGVIPLEHRTWLSKLGLISGEGPKQALLCPCTVTREIVEMIVHHHGLVACWPHLITAATIAQGGKLAGAGCRTATADFLVEVKAFVLLKLLSTGTAA